MKATDLDGKKHWVLCYECAKTREPKKKLHPDGFGRCAECGMAGDMQFYLTVEPDEKMEIEYEETD